MSPKAKGKLIIIGGHEERDGDQEREILKEVARESIEKKGDLVLITVASQQPKEMAKMYNKAFKELGVSKMHVVDIRKRTEAEEKEVVEKIENASVIFFTGGDQLRITSQVGDSLTYQTMRKKLEEGSTVAGTSAGAAAMPETMIIGGESDSSQTISSLSMAPGLGLIEGVIIDSHFAERGRIARLLGAVADNPRNLGLGIDEDTAVIFEDAENFRVIGSGAVYVVDGSTIDFSSLSEKNSEGIISIFNVRLHVLTKGDRFDLVKRVPTFNEQTGKEVESSGK